MTMGRVLLVAALFGLGGAAAAAQERILRLGLYIPQTHVHVQQALLPWLAEVNEVLREEGAEIRVFAGGALGRDAAQQARALRTGVLDLTWFVAGFSAGRYSGTELVEFPFVSDDPELLTRAFWRLYERGMLPSLDEFKPLALSVSPAYYFHLNFEVASLEDMAGRKIRVTDAAQARAVRAMGATAVAGIGGNELAESLSRRLIDGALFSWHATGAMGVERVTHTHIMQPMTFVTSILAMNRDTFESLSPRAQALIDATRGEALSLAYTRSMLGEARRAVERVSAEEDRHLYTPTAEERSRFQETFEALVEQWLGGDPDRRRVLGALEEVLQEIAAEDLAAEGEHAPRGG